METLILYASKYGAASEAAEHVAEHLGGSVTLHDLGRKDIPSLDKFECVIIGSSIYAGSIRKEARAFVLQYAYKLRDKKFGLFLCGLDENTQQAYFEKNFSSDILGAAKATAFFGGIFDPKKANFFERFIMKAVSKRSTYTNTLHDEKIKQFAEDMKA